MNRYIELANDLDELRHYQYAKIYFGGVIGFVSGLLVALAFML